MKIDNNNSARTEINNMMHILYPIIMNIFYINVPKNELQKFTPNMIFTFSLFHNIFLHLFSVYTFTKLSLVLWEHNIVGANQYYFQIKGVDSILFWFYMSKYYEFIDTFILYAKNKDPICLQKYHHIGASFMWHLGYVYKFDGILFASLLNSGVHSIMYLYYFCSMFPCLSSNLRKYKIYITSAQVAQLVYGAIALPWFYYKLETKENKVVIIIFDIYIAVLLLLFGNFMIVNYLSNKIKAY